MRHHVWYPFCVPPKAPRPNRRDIPWWIYLSASLGLHTFAVAAGLLLMALGYLLARWVNGGAL